MGFGTWNVRCLYSSVSLMSVARELARYKLDLVGVQEVRWDRGGSVRAGDYFFLRKRNENHQLGNAFVYNTEHYQQLRAEFVTDRTPYIVLRGRWCNIIVLNDADVNILGRSVHIRKKNTEVLLVASKEIGLEVNADKSTYSSNHIVLAVRHTHTHRCMIKYCMLRVQK